MPLVSIRAPASGIWRADVGSLAVGDTAADVRQAIGGETSADAATILRRRPPPPAMLVVRAPQTIHAWRKGPIVRGTGAAGGAVTVTANETAAGSATVAGDGSWSIDLAALGAGWWRLVFVQVAGGVTYPAAIRTLAVDAPPSWVVPEASFDYEYSRRRGFVDNGGDDHRTFDAATLFDDLTASRASLETYFNSSGSLADAANDVTPIAYDPSTLAALGAQLMGARTNKIRNPRCEGAAAGSPGSLPANWLQSYAVGLSASVLGTVAHLGGECVDLELYGTTSSGSTAGWYFEANNQIAAANGQTWANTLFAQVLSDPQNVLGTSVFLDAVVLQYNSGGSSLGSFLAAESFKASALTWGRRGGPVALNNADTAYVRPGVFFRSIVVGTNFGTSGAGLRIRIGLPQIEQGAFASSPIRPPVSSPAAATRAADVLTAAVGGWFNTAAGTAVPQYRCPFVSGTTPQCVFSIDDGTADNRITLWAKDASGNVVFEVVAGGLQRCYINGGAAVAGQAEKVAVSWKANQFALSRNGATPVTGGSGALPTGLATLRKGSTSAGQHLFGTLARLPILPVDKTGSALQALSA